MHAAIHLSTDIWNSEFDDFFLVPFLELQGDVVGISITTQGEDTSQTIQPGLPQVVMILVKSLAIENLSADR